MEATSVRMECERASAIRLSVVRAGATCLRATHSVRTAVIKHTIVFRKSCPGDRRIAADLELHVPRGSVIRDA